MKFSMRNKVKKAMMATAATAAIIAGIGWAAPAFATASAASPGGASQATASVTPNSCANLKTQFAANGVRIHASASTSSRTVGWGSKGQTFAICSWNGQWNDGKDLKTGKWGWVRSAYLN